jgi:hypothetical protein
VAVLLTLGAYSIIKIKLSKNNPINPIAIFTRRSNNQQIQIEENVPHQPQPRTTDQQNMMI